MDDTLEQPVAIVTTTEQEQSDEQSSDDDENGLDWTRFPCVVYSDFCAIFLNL